ncbi:unannotated protein [freshwater metagenome]|uniref:Unannotated protein n=1 Tax=freshwater metagenome TaxID=449393 RepID=A0A6J7IS94_9ZZZZ
MRPSPIRDEKYRPNILIAASAIASSPTKIANLVINVPFFGITPSSMRRRSRSGVVTTSAASTTTVPRNIKMLVRYGRANSNILLTVPGFNFWAFTDGSAVIERWVIQAA